MASPDPQVDRATSPPHVDDPHIVILLHGIRTFAEWQARITPDLVSTQFTPHALTYHRFGLPRFLWPTNHFRLSVYYRIAQDLSFIKDNNTNARVSVIAHSFGTDILGWLLQNTNISFYKIVLCGSILPETFPFSAFQSKLGVNKPNPLIKDKNILNICGENDIWPIMAWFATWWYGKSGRFGFHDGSNVINVYCPIAHDYFKEEVQLVEKLIIPFLRDRPIETFGKGPVSWLHGWLGRARLVTILAILLSSWLLWNAKTIGVSLGVLEDQTIVQVAGEWRNVENYAKAEAKWRKSERLSVAHHQWCSDHNDIQLQNVIDSELGRNRDFAEAVEKLATFYVSLGTRKLQCDYCDYEYACVRWGIGVEDFLLVYRHIPAYDEPLLEKNQLVSVRWRNDIATKTRKWLTSLGLEPVGDGISEWLRAKVVDSPNFRMDRFHQACEIWLESMRTESCSEGSLHTMDGRQE